MVLVQLAVPVRQDVFRELLVLKLLIVLLLVRQHALILPLLFNALVNIRRPELDGAADISRQEILVVKGLHRNENAD